jgi:hypothetical protein
MYYLRNVGYSHQLLPLDFSLLNSGAAALVHQTISNHYIADLAIFV